jgi:KDO transferase-3
MGAMVIALGAMMQNHNEKNPLNRLSGNAFIPMRDFCDCRNQYSGSVLLLASGGSAASFPVSRYARIPFVAMNGSITRLADENIEPMFYICDDKSFTESRPDLAVLGARLAQHVAMSFQCFQTLQLFDSEVLQHKRAYLLERVNRRHGYPSVSDRRFAWSIRNDPDLISGFSLFRQKPNRIGFSRNMCKGYFVGRTIVYCATQLVYFLGFRRVFIVGMDLKSSAGRFYEQGQNALPTRLDCDFDQFILPSFRILKKNIIDKEDFKVFNLSRDSRMPESVLPKIDLEQFEELLKNANSNPLR